jgi:DNA adenine methylase
VKIRSLAPWFGAKRAQAPGIVRLFGRHSAYWEPFAASCSVLFAKPPARCEVVNDLHGGLVNLARCVASDELAPRLFERLGRTAFCRAIHEEACARLDARPGTLPAPAQPDPGWAYDYLVASWMGRNGLAGTANEAGTGFCVRYTTTGGDPAARFRNAAASLPDWWRRLRNATILNTDGIALCGRIGDEPGTVVYCDPPYIAEGDEYLHPFSPEQHRALAEALARFARARVVVSYYDHPDLGPLYADRGWARLYPDARRSMGGGDRGRAPEVLLLNPPMAAAAGEEGMPCA